MRDRVALVASAIVAAIHLSVANRYDLFRDELYFIVCGRHPAFGYADQPPLVPLLAALGYAIDPQTWFVRLPSVVAAAALVWLVVAFARLLGARDGAAWAAGLAAGFAPMLMGITAILTTGTFEPLAWTFVAYALARAVVLGDRRILIWAGVAAGLELEVKYALPLWLCSLAVGLCLVPERRVLKMRELWIGLGSALVLAVPSIVWQAAHGFPFVELVQNAGMKDMPATPLGFALNQLVVLNPLLAPLWVLGLAAPFFVRRFEAMRFVALGAMFAAIAIVAGHGKDYYLAGIYPSLFAIGSVALQSLVRNLVVRSLYVSAALAVSVAVAPLALPILPPARLAAYERAIKIGPTSQERGDVGAAIPPQFADMFGWHDFVRRVALAYDAIPQPARSRTAILVDNYGEAAAIDVYGAAYHLPPALSGHNQYYFWGSRGQRPLDLVRVQDHPERLRRYCERMLVVGETQSTYGRALENGKAIAVCYGLHPPLSELWPLLREMI